MGKKSRNAFTKNASSQEQAPERMQNGLGEAVGYPGVQAMAQGTYLFGMPGSGGSQLSQSDTMFKNLRNYLVSNFRQLLSQAYAEIGLIQTVVDLPVDDALRGGVKIKTKQLNESEIKQLEVRMEECNDLQVLGQTAKWNRLFGGAGTIILLDDQDPEDELDVEAIDSDTKLVFRSADMWEFYWDYQINDGDEESLEIEASEDEHFTYYGEPVNKSRVLKMKGKRPPSWLRPRTRGWGLSVVEVLVRSVNQYLKTTDLTFEVLDEFKLDIFKIAGLAQALQSPTGEAAIQKRVAIANWQKNYQNALVMDIGDDYDHKQLSFTGIAEVMQGVRMQIASDLRMPLTKVFGMSAAGFNSGEDDIENYNAMIESEIRSKIKFDLLKMIKLRCQNEFGFIPDDLTIEFPPLRILSAEQEENIKTQKFTRLLQAKQAGEISTLEFRHACNRDNLLGIQMDTSDASILPPDADKVGAPKAGLGGDGSVSGKGNPGSEENEGSNGKTEVPRSRPNLRMVNAWEESKHPRASDGKFGEGGGAKASSKAKSKVASIDEKGQIKIKTPKSVSEASELLETVSAFFAEAEKKAEESPSFENNLRLHHAAKQFQRAYKLSKTVHSIAKGSKLSNGYETQVTTASTVLPKVVHQKLFVLPKPFSHKEKRKRLRNSADFDRASYEADGGDAWVDPRRKLFFDDPLGVDQVIWAQALERAREVYGDPARWQFVLWMYRKLGGHFNNAANN